MCEVHFHEVLQAGDAVEGTTIPLQCVRWMLSHPLPPFSISLSPTFVHPVFCFAYSPPCTLLSGSVATGTYQFSPDTHVQRSVSLLFFQSQHFIVWLSDLESQVSTGSWVSELVPNFIFYH
jgi:hypothetical protein